MSSENHVSRRDFLVAGGALTASAMVGQSALGQEKAGDAKKLAELAVNGGPKAVPDPRPGLVRWGDPERTQLTSCVDQSSLLYWNGPQTKLMTERFQQFCPLEHVMTCSSGTAAVHIAVAAAGIAPGDEVITTPISDMGTVIGVLFQQAVPVFADLRPHTANLDPEDVERKITKKTKAIIAVHLSGNPCDMDALVAIAKKHNLVLIEDCAQAWGARYRGKPVGTMGDFACFSLQNSKHITCGDGGVVATNNPDYGSLIRRYGDKGVDRAGWNGFFEHFATNYRMNELSASFVAAQFERLEEIAAKRSALGTLLGQELEGIPGVDRHEVHSEDRATFWSYWIRPRLDELTCDRAQFARALATEGAPASAGYIPTTLYGNPIFQQHSFFGGIWPAKEMGATDMDYTKVSCPEAEAILATCIRLSINEAMSEDYIRQIGAAVRKVAGAYARA